MQIVFIMTKEDWNQHVQLLQLHVNEYNQYDAGYTYKQKEKFSNQRLNAVKKIKMDLEWPPFAQIAQKVSNSPWGFAECFDSMDGDMERTIREIMKKSID